jgi:hypothetical protein
MKKEYLHPDTEVLRIALECNFLDSFGGDALGSDLGTPVIIGGDFDSLF